MRGFKANNVTDEKKDDDLFDVRYLPEEYMSDVQEDSDEEEEAAEAKRKEKEE